MIGYEVYPWPELLTWILRKAPAILPPPFRLCTLGPMSANP